MCTFLTGSGGENWQNLWDGCHNAGSNPIRRRVLGKWKQTNRAAKVWESDAERTIKDQQREWLFTGCTKSGTGLLLWHFLNMLCYISNTRGKLMVFYFSKDYLITFILLLIIRGDEENKEESFMENILLISFPCPTLLAYG